VGFIFLFIFIDVKFIAHKHMSKNQDRYKEDYTEIDVEELEEIETERFEKFRPKKKGKNKPKHKDAYQSDDE
jgi:hypothetical protein